MVLTDNPATCPPIRAWERIWSTVAERLPLLAFFGVYLFTCYVGAIGLLTSERFRTLYLVFSGAQPPALAHGDIWRVWLLLNLAPLALWIGYEGGVLLWRTRRAVARPVRTIATRRGRWLARIVAAASVVVALISLGRAGAWETASAWTNYNAYVYTRWRLFDTLTFLEFVNLYTLLPVTIMYWALRERPGVASIALATIVTLGLQYPLALRKVLLTSLAFFGAIAYVYWNTGRHPRLSLKPRTHILCWLGLPLLLYLSYSGLTLQTVLRSDSQPFQTIQALVPPAIRVAPSSDEEVTFRVDAGAIARVQQNRARSVITYTLLSPLTRTSICALAYPAVFPRVLPFYRLDLGQDILGFGAMPDDNLTIYRVLWPHHHRGSVAAPFIFVLYSQGGLIVSLLGSLLVGISLGLAWMALTDRDTLGVEHALGAGLLIVLGVFLAIDSLRNSLLVSYGLGWGFALTAVLFLLARQGTRTDVTPMDSVAS